VKSLEEALRPLINREATAWLNHHDLKVLTGRLVEIGSDHIVLKAGEHTYLIPYGAIAAIRPAAQ
jgi:hypothetical protein